MTVTRLLRSASASALLGASMLTLPAVSAAAQEQETRYAAPQNAPISLTSCSSS